jgi:hypothetical protein
VGFENNFNGTTFHHHFCLKTGVSRKGLSLEYSEQNTSTVHTNVDPKVCPKYVTPKISHHQLLKN